MSLWDKVIFAISVLAIAILFGFVFLMRSASLDAVIAFMGVLVGGLITGFVQYWISDADRKQRLRLAALDKRLQTAQDAYSLWFQLRRLPRPTPSMSKSVVKVLHDCQKWWEKNSLYLTPEARSAFRDAYHAADNLAHARQNGTSWQEMEKLNSEIERAGSIIEESVFLPSIGELVAKRTTNKVPKKKKNDT